MARWYHADAGGGDLGCRRFDRRRQRRSRSRLLLRNPAQPRPPTWCARLETEVTAAARQLERRDTDGVLRHVSEQYRTGPFTKPALRSQIQTMFSLYDAMKVQVRIDTVRMVGDHAWVYSSGELTGHFTWLDRWVSVLSWQRELEVFVARTASGDCFGYQR